MNDHFVPPPNSDWIDPCKPEVQPHPLSHWFKRFLACNPFYLVSAGMLLYGLYRISVDPHVFAKEIAHLFFNFGSLQFYELLLVGTAIFLARRRIWYDSTLLIFLENLFILVPFILVSQAALIHTRWVWTTCLAASAVAVVRTGGLKRLIPELNLPKPLVGMGALLLLANCVLPIVYRVLHESKVGKHPDTGAAFCTNECVWLLVLPALCALPLLLPRTRNTGDLLPQRGWLAPAWLSLWLAGTAVHLYCMGYVYDFELRLELIVPTIWVLLWVLNQKWTPAAPEAESGWRHALLIPPFVATFLAMTEPHNTVFLTLMLLNSGIYAALRYRHPDNRLGMHLFFLSLTALLVGVPQELGRVVVAGFTREAALWAGIALYLLALAVLSRDPKFAFLGAFVSAGIVSFALGNHANAPHWALQAAFVFILLHSLRWEDAAHSGAAALRFMAAAGWVIHAFVWAEMEDAGWLACAIAGPVLVGYVIHRLLAGKRASLVIPIAAALVMLTGPGQFAVGTARAMPAGVMAVLASFLLFGAGTLMALNKHRWHR